MSCTITKSNYRICPCGQGYVVSLNYDYDNGYSRDYTTYEIECHACHKTWIVNEKTLVNIESERLRDLAVNEREATRKAYNIYCKQITDDYLIGHGSKIEFSILNKIECLTCGRNTYYRNRRNGSKISTMCEFVPDLITSCFIKELSGINIIDNLLRDYMGKELIAKNIRVTCLGIDRLDSIEN